MVLSWVLVGQGGGGRVEGISSVGGRSHNKHHERGQ